MCLLHWHQSELCWQLNNNIHLHNQLDSHTLPPLSSHQLLIVLFSIMLSCSIVFVLSLITSHPFWSPIHSAVVTHPHRQPKIYNHTPLLLHVAATQPCHQPRCHHCMLFPLHTLAPILDTTMWPSLHESITTSPNIIATITQCCCRQPRHHFHH